jgi:hypothetical protein
MEKVKTQIVFPAGLLKRLDQVVKKKERSLFVVEAVEEKLKGLNLQNALKSVAGLWKDREDLKTDTDVKKYLKNLRESDTSREKRLRKAWRDA